MKTALYLLLPFYLLSFISSTAGEEIFGWSIFLVFLFDFAFDIKRTGFRSTFKNLKIGPDVPVLFFGAWALLCSILIFKNPKNFYEVLGNIRWIFLLYGFSYLLKKYFTMQIEKYFNFIMIATILIGIYGTVQMFTRIDLWRDSNSHMSAIGSFYRATGFYTVPLTYAYCIGMVGIFGFTALILQIKDKKAIILPLLATISTVAGIIASSTRGAWIAFFIATITITFLLDRKKAGLVFVFSLLVAGPMMFEPTIQQRALSIFDLKNQASNTERISLWKANFEMFKDHPILGVGLEKSRSQLGEYYKRLNITDGFDGHAHNDLLNTLSGVGLPGTIAWIWFCGYFVFIAYKLFKNSTLYKLQVLTLGALGAQIYFFIGGITQCNFSDNEVNHILVFTWALLIGIQSKFFSNKVEVKKIKYFQ